MIKTIELIVVATLLIFSFFAGVKYSDSVKNHASWLFETKDEEEVALPDLSNESGVEISAPTEEGMDSSNTSGHSMQESAPAEVETDSQPQQPQPKAN